MGTLSGTAIGYSDSKPIAQAVQALPFTIQRYGGLYAAEPVEQMLSVSIHDDVGTQYKRARLWHSLSLNWHDARHHWQDCHADSRKGPPRATFSNAPLYVWLFSLIAEPHRYAFSFPPAAFHFAHIEW